MRRPSGRALVEEAASCAFCCCCCCLVMYDDVSDEVEGNEEEELGVGLYSLMLRSALPVRMYVPGLAEYERAWIGPSI